MTMSSFPPSGLQHCISRTWGEVAVNIIYCLHASFHLGPLFAAIRVYPEGMLLGCRGLCLDSRHAGLLTSVQPVKQLAPPIPARLKLINWPVYITKGLKFPSFATCSLPTLSFRLKCIKCIFFPLHFQTLSTFQYVKIFRQKCLFLIKGVFLIF